MEKCVLKSNESQNECKPELELHAESVNRAILNIAIIRSQGLQFTLDHLAEHSPRADLQKHAYHADAMLCLAAEALRVLNYALAIQIKHESEQSGVA
jgi:hypothetical protein